jgi:hypothetical protein
MASALAAGPPRPTSEPSVEIGDAEVERFREQGFLSVERITTDEEVAWLARVWDELFADRRTWFDLATPFGALDRVRVGQMLLPEARAPALRETLYFRNAPASRRASSRGTRRRSRPGATWC